MSKRGAARGSQAKPINFANCHYISPKKGKRGGTDHLQGKLKYFQFRDDKHDYIRQGSRDRWVDMGLGNNYFYNRSCGSEFMRGYWKKSGTSPSHGIDERE